MGDTSGLPQAWIKLVAGIIYDFHRADILHKLDKMTDEEIDAALEKLPPYDYNRSSMQAPRVAPEKPTTYAGLVPAPQNCVG
jgi:hypothetical protein|tara:strand:+ start:301 stop:546 length:246 start_codon:yes stop_codon:yes gene_type:complete